MILQGGILWMLSYILPLWAVRVAVVGWRFLSRWLKTRRLVRLPAALIPLLIGTAVGTSLLVSRNPRWKSRLSEHYLTSAREAVQHRDLPSVRLNYRRVLSMPGSSESLSFEFAKSMANLGESDECLRMMSRLAPLHKSGYVPAHRFLADHLRGQDTRNTDLMLAVHLNHIIRQSTDSRAERLQLVTLLAGYRSYDKADTLLRATLDEYPEDRLTLARLKAKSGQVESAREEAQAACKSLRQLLASEPENVDRRLQLAQGHVFLAESPAALTVLAEGLAVELNETDSSRLLDAIARTYEHWISLLDERQQFAQRECLLTLTGNSGKHETEPALSAVNSTTDDSSVLLRHILRSERVSVVMPLLIGTASAASGDLALAEQQLRRGLTLDPEQPSLRNNLAWVLIQRAIRMDQTPTETHLARSDEHVTVLHRQDLLNEAQELLDLALTTSAGVAEFHETRSQARRLMGKHDAAVADLLACVELGLVTPAIYRSLSASLRTLGRIDESRHYDQLAEQIHGLP